jgi:hypothetical protein
MFIASLEQMRRYGMPQEDIAAALSLARRMLALDAAVFPGVPCILHMARSGGPIQCAQYITIPGNGESYVIYVESVADRLRYAAAALMAEHAHHGFVDETAARGFVVDAIALHEVRHRLQEHRGSALRLWHLTDLPPDDEEVMRHIIAELAPEARTKREIDARIVEFLYVRGRIAGFDDPVYAACRVPD